MAAAMGLLLLQKRLSRKIKKKKAAISISSWRSSLPAKEKEEEEEVEVEVEKTLYVRVGTLKDPADWPKDWFTSEKEKEASDWYKIKLSNKDSCLAIMKRKIKTTRKKAEEEPLRIIEPVFDEERLCIKPILTKVPHRWNSCFVALDSVIYCISPGYYSSSDVVSWDTQTTTTTTINCSNSFLPGKQVQSMRFKREGLCSLAVVADGKIYVFGGLLHYYFNDDNDADLYEPEPLPVHDYEENPTPTPTPIPEDVDLVRKMLYFSTNILEGIYNAPLPPPPELLSLPTSVGEQVRHLCEVFDPDKNKWEPINAAPPPQLLPVLFSAGEPISALYAFYDHTKNRIIFCSFVERGFLIAYYVRDAVWETLAREVFTSIESPDDFVYTTAPVLFDHTVYWIESRQLLYAYDLNSQRLFKGTIVGVPCYFWNTICGGMQFFHFHGDYFYLIWLDNYQRNTLRCDGIRISKSVDEQKPHGCLTAYVLSTKFYATDTTKPSGIRAVLL